MWIPREGTHPLREWYLPLQAENPYKAAAAHANAVVEVPTQWSLGSQRPFGVGGFHDSDRFGQTRSHSTSDPIGFPVLSRPRPWRASRTARWILPAPQPPRTEVMEWRRTEVEGPRPELEAGWLQVGATQAQPSVRHGR